MLKETKNYMKQFIATGESPPMSGMKTTKEMQISFAKSNIIKPTLEEFPHMSFITLTLHPRQYNCTSKTQRLRIIAAMKLLVMRTQLQRYAYVMEFTKKGNLHVHMWAVMKGMKQFVSFTDFVKFSNVFGSFFVTPNKEPDVKTYMDQIHDMYEYMIKDLTTTVEVCESYEISKCSDEDSYVYQAMETVMDSAFTRSFQAIDETEINYDW